MKWRYPLSDIDLGKEEEREVLKVLRSRWLSTGPVTESFEQAFSEYLGGGYCIAVSNGTAALHLALASLDIQRGDEVILPSLTFVATASAVLYTGATPVFADVCGENNLNISPEDIERKITAKTKAILVVHYAGQPCRMPAISEIARAHGLYLVEDAAHAPGAESQKKLGTIGEAGCFSFFSNKNMVTGEGGMVFTPDKHRADKIRKMRSHGIGRLSWDKYLGHASSYDIDCIGYNYRITEIQSALGLVQLQKLDRLNQKRKALIECYKEELEGVDHILIPFKENEGRPSNHILPVLMAKGKDGLVLFPRDQLMKELAGYGIQTSIHYPPVHLFTLYRQRVGCKKGMLPVTEDVSQRELTLPLHPLMHENDVRWIAGKIKSIIAGK